MYCEEVYIVTPEINSALRFRHPELCLTAFAEIYDFVQNVPMRAGSNP